jgi:hypothetical protein
VGIYQKDTPEILAEDVRLLEMNLKVSETKPVKATQISD